MNPVDVGSAQGVFAVAPNVIGHRSVAGVVSVHPAVLGAYPEDSIAIGRQGANHIAAMGLVGQAGVEVPVIEGVAGQITQSAKIGPYPYSAFGGAPNGVNGIVAQ